ncbi:alpha-E domain-containing protein [Ruminococcus sp.]|uniref:alpha-E domain-containing protein n=1 Tax=Ruminococcus sp. TaxID=41978 RepID=UPI003F06440A
MGIITLEKSDHLFWLGRYTERVHTTLKMYLKSSDRMIDSDPNYYSVYCKKIGITNIYGSRENFAKTYPFDDTDPNSIISNLNRAYDNAIVMRDYIGTETMAYIQLAIDDIKTAERGDTPLADLMLAIDHILAFWGCVNDLIDDEQIRNIIKLGKGVERIDLYLSLNRSAADIQKEYRRMKQFLAKSLMRYDESVLYTMDNMLSEYEFDYMNVRNLLRNLFTVSQ